MKETHVAPTFHVSSHVYLGAKKLSILPVFLGFFLGTNMLNRLVAATAGTGLFKLAEQGEATATRAI